MILKYLQRIFAPIAIAFLTWFAWDSRAELAALVQGTMPVYQLNPPPGMLSPISWCTLTIFCGGCQSSGWSASTALLSA